MHPLQLSLRAAGAVLSAVVGLLLLRAGAGAGSDGIQVLSGVLGGLGIAGGTKLGCDTLCSRVTGDRSRAPSTSR